MIQIYAIFFVFCKYFANICKIINIQITLPKTIVMLKEERQQVILEKLGTDKKVTLVDLGQILSVSYDSVRRDIIELEDKGLIKESTRWSNCTILISR